MRANPRYVWRGDRPRAEVWRLLARARAMVLSTIFLFGFITYSHFRLLAARGLLGDVRGQLRNFDYLWLRPGLFRRLLPASRISRQ